MDDAHQKAANLRCKKANINHKYRMPLRDEEKAYERIDGDFQKSIGKGYDQAKEVEDRFISEDSFEIFDKQKRKIATFDPLILTKYSL